MGSAWRPLGDRLRAAGYAGFADLADELDNPRKGYASTLWPNGRPVEQVRDHTRMLLDTIAYEYERGRGR